MVDILSDVFPQLNLDWSRVRFLFCDERIVPVDHAESTFGTYLRKLVPKMADQITEGNFVSIDTTMSGTVLPISVEFCSVEMKRPSKLT